MCLPNRSSKYEPHKTKIPQNLVQPKKIIQTEKGEKTKIDYKSIFNNFLKIKEQKLERAKNKGITARKLKEEKKAQEKRKLKEEMEAFNILKEEK